LTFWETQSIARTIAWRRDGGLITVAIAHLTQPQGEQPLL
jgi:hypothetical protein